MARDWGKVFALAREAAKEIAPVVGAAITAHPGARQVVETVGLTLAMRRKLQEAWDAFDEATRAGDTTAVPPPVPRAEVFVEGVIVDERPPRERR